MPCTVRMYLRMPGGLGSIFCRSHATWTSTVRVDGIDATAPGGGSALRVLRMRIFSGRRGTEGTEQASTRRHGGTEKFWPGRETIPEDQSSPCLRVSALKARS